jgi:hypothetical protein
MGAERAGREMDDPKVSAISRREARGVPGSGHACGVSPGRAGRVFVVGRHRDA